MVEKFKNDETGYEQWLRENQTGYVFNYFKTTVFNKMHHASCSFLKRPKDAGARTKLDKYCSESYSELEYNVHRLCKDNWSKCKHCFK
jgi:hypothetical protein